MNSAKILAQGAVPTEFNHEPQRITPRRAVMDLVGQNYQLAHQVFIY